MNTESITRKRLGTTYTRAEFVCVMGNVVALECTFTGGEEVRITLPLDQLDHAVAKAKVKSSNSMTEEEKQAELEERFRQSQDTNQCYEFDQQHKF